MPSSELDRRTLPTPDKKPPIPLTDTVLNPRNLDLPELALSIGGVFPLVRIGDPIFEGVILDFPLQSAQLHEEDGVIKLDYRDPQDLKDRSIHVTRVTRPANNIEAAIFTGTLSNGEITTEKKIKIEFGEPVRVIDSED